MSWQDCADNIRQAAGRDLDDATVMRLFEDVQMRADRLKRERVDLSHAELVRAAAQEASAEADMAARIEARNRKMNLVKRVERRRFYESAPDLLLGIEAKLVGANTPFAGARLSVATQAQTLTRDYAAGVTIELERAGLYGFVRDGKADRAIARELFELNRPDGEPGSSKNPQAAQAAAIIHKFQEAARLGMNKEGAWVGQYDGWIARTSHDADRIRRATYETWKADFLAGADERTFDGIDDREGFLKGVYNGLVTGIHLTPDGMQGFKDPAFSGPGNLGKRLSQGRKLHFRDADAWMDYQAKYGGRTLIENVLGGLSNAARNTALMREFGTNPRAEFDGDLKFLEQTWRDRDPTTATRLTEARGMLSNRFDELDGTASRPVNHLAAKIGSSIRLTQSMAKLGGVVLSAITDVPFKAAELRYQGIGLLEGYADGIATILRAPPKAPWSEKWGRGAGDNKDVIDLLRAGADGMLGNIAARFDSANDSAPGVLSKLANTYFRWTGLTYWTDAQRAGAEFVMARHLGKLVGTDFADLPKPTRRLLGMFGIAPEEWDALHQVELVKADGRAFLTPDAALKLSDEAVESILGDKLHQANSAALDRLAKVVEGVDRLESRLARLAEVAAKAVPTRNDVDAIDVAATVEAYGRQLGAVSALRDKVLAMRDGGATPGQVLKRLPREIQALVDAEKRITANAVRRMDALAARLPKAEARRIEAELAMEKVKAEMLDRLDEMTALPDRLEAEMARLRDKAREDLALKIHAYYADRGEYAVLAPGARERAILRQGTRAGTPAGEALRFVTQFKAFPVAVMSKAWGREIHGGNHGMGRVAGIVHMMVAATAFGYVAGMLKDLWKLRTPRDPRDPATWGAAFLQGGGAGIYGDFLLGKASRFGNSALETVAGPTFSAAGELVNIWNGARAGDDKSAAMLRWTVSNTPFANLFYTRAGLDYLFLYQVQEALNPGFLRRFEARVERENGQRFLLKPSSVLKD